MRKRQMPHSAGRHRSLLSGIVALAPIAMGGRVIVAQTVTSPQADPSAPAALRVMRASGDMRLEGTLAEAVWSRADSITDFRQREPLEGATASERTVVKVLRDAEALYVAVYAYDRNPPAIRASQLRRDADLSSDDNITVLIDSFHDSTRSSTSCVRNAERERSRAAIDRLLGVVEIHP